MAKSDKRSLRAICERWMETDAVLFNPRTGVAVLAYDTLRPENAALVAHRKSTNVLARAVLWWDRAAAVQLRTYALALKTGAFNSTPTPPDPLKEALHWRSKIWALVDTIQLDLQEDVPQRELNIVEQRIVDHLRDASRRGVQQGVYVTDLDGAAGIKPTKNGRKQRQRALTELRSRGLAVRLRRGWWASGGGGDR